MEKIKFYELNIKSQLLERRSLKKFLLDIFKNQRIKIESVTIIFCTDKFLRGLNKKFLSHDYYTDTLTFNLSSVDEPLIGEAYLSIDRIKKNAKSLDIKYQHELIRVIIHSCLHLCGYEDKPKKKYSKMVKLQEFYLKKWLVSRETQIG